MGVNYVGVSQEAMAFRQGAYADANKILEPYGFAGVAAIGAGAAVPLGVAAWGAFLARPGGSTQGLTFRGGAMAGDARGGGSVGGAGTVLAARYGDDALRLAGRLAQSATPTRDALVAANRARTAALRSQYGGLSSAERMTRIDTLASANYNRLLERDLSQVEYVYRGVSLEVLDIYRETGRISTPRGQATYFSIEGGSTLIEHMSRSQLRSEPEALLRIPVSELDSAFVPRPFGYTRPESTFGREYFVNSYPEYGVGGYRQFMATTKTFSESWIVKGWGKIK
mgnify:FL=1